MQALEGGAGQTIAPETCRAEARAEQTAVVARPSRSQVESPSMPPSGVGTAHTFAIRECQPQGVARLTAPMRSAMRANAELGRIRRWYSCWPQEVDQRSMESEPLWSDRERRLIRSPSG